MIKKIFLFYFISLSVTVFANNLMNTVFTRSFIGVTEYLVFDEINLTKTQYRSDNNEKYYIEVPYIKQYRYTVTSDRGFSFLHLTNDSESLFYIYLFNDDILILLNDGYEEHYSRFAVQKFGRNGEMFNNIVSMHGEITYSSFFTERGQEYKFIGGRDFYIPWVEGKTGSGIGEYFEFTSHNRFNDKGYFIVNGFVRFNRPDLYYANNRIKKLKVEVYDNNRKINEIIVELLDTPNPQNISLNLKLGQRARFTILEVYRGTKFDDTSLMLVAQKSDF